MDMGEAGKIRDVALELGFAGCGNVTMNPRFMAYVEGRLIYTEIDLTDPLSSFSKANPSIVVWEDGRPEYAEVQFILSPKAKAAPVSEAAKFFSAGAKDFTLRVNGEERTAKEIRYILQGPLLVDAGRAKKPRSIIKMAANGWFYDLRHVIMFPRLQFPDWSANVGLENMWNSGTLVSEEVRKALKGQVIEIELSPYQEALTRPGGGPWKQVLIDALHKALYAKSKSQLPNVGEYRFTRTKLRIAYRSGVYNHSLLGLTAGKELIWLGLAGLGNRLGVTMADTARLARLNGFQYAILVDNGGDVMLSVRDQFVLSSTYGRGHIRGLLLFVSPGKCLLVSPEKYLQTENL